MKFLVVLHKWFMDSEGWDLHEVNADSFADAEEKARAIQSHYNSTFCRCDTYVLGEHWRPRKLSWWERLTGKLR